jgi:hypothetical protein
MQLNASSLSKQTPLFKQGSDAHAFWPVLQIYESLSYGVIYVNTQNINHKRVKGLVKGNMPSI